MYATIHKSGTSFLGIAQYVLHDEDRAQSSDRVAWVETRNLSTKDGMTAARVMAATAMSQDAIKAEAGIPNTGRKSSKHVMHYTLCWAPEETQALSKDEMMKAVHQSLGVLGHSGRGKNQPRMQLASEHQALVVCHHEKDHLHVHVIVNRVNPNHGVILPSSNDHLKLSSWALRYEQERGKVYFPAREINARARERGEWVKAPARLPRNQYETLKALETDEEGKSGDGKTQAFLKDQAQKDAAIYEQRRALLAKTQEQSKALQDAHAAREASIDDLTTKRSRQATRDVQQSFHPRWTDLYHKHQAELVDFNASEEYLVGRIRNAMKAMDFKAMFSGQERAQAISEGFQALSDSGARLEGFKKKQAADDKRLRTEQDAAYQESLAPIEADRDLAHSENRQLYLAEHMQLKLQQRMDWAKHHAEWKARNQERRDEVKAFLAEHSENDGEGREKTLGQYFEERETHERDYGTHEPDQSQNLEPER